jgi:uncharacterized protein
MVVSVGTIVQAAGIRQFLLLLCLKSDPDMLIENLLQWEKRFIEYFQAQGAQEDGAHDIGHFKRVWRTASRINEAEGSTGDALVLLAASYFHDVISLPKDHPDRSQSSRLSATRAGELLRDHFTGFPGEKVYGVQHAILTHSFSAAIPPESYEAKILQDADRMEALGAIGIARTFYTAGLMHSRLFHDEDPLGLHRDLNDKQYSLDHFQVKLLQLPLTMRTHEGKRIAEEKARILLVFREQMVREINGE